MPCVMHPRRPHVAERAPRANGAVMSLSCRLAKWPITSKLNPTWVLKSAPTLNRMDAPKGLTVCVLPVGQVGVDIAAASPATARATLQEMNHALVARMQQKKDTQKQGACPGLHSAAASPADQHCKTGLPELGHYP